VTITGYGQPEDRQRALDSGFDTHLTKPVTPGDLASTFSDADATGSISP
jgi:CheY-like chemotaxis protein